MFRRMMRGPCYNRSEPRDNRDGCLPIRIGDAEIGSRIVQSGEFFVVGGPVQPERACYVERAADEALRQGLLDRRFCYVLGPKASGKTSLLEAILARTGAVEKPGSVTSGSAIGDSSPEARAHSMSVELNIAETSFLDDTYTFIDCPGSVEFDYESEPLVGGIDAAIVVADEWQRRGIAHRLMRQLIDTACSRSLESMEGEVLADNHEMLNLAGKLGFDIEPCEDDPGMKHISRRL